MKKTIQKIIFFVLSIMILFLLIRWAFNARESKNPYVRFPDKIETFR